MQIKLHSTMSRFGFKLLLLIIDRIN